MYRRIFTLILTIIIIALTSVMAVSMRTRRIPKIIWTYWDSPTLPEVVQTCINSWQRSNPDFTIIVVNPDNLKHYVDDVDILSLKHTPDQPRISDFVRLHCLAKYGGVWADASIYMTTSLDWLLDLQKSHNYEFIGYYHRNLSDWENLEYPVIVNWFFACVPKCTFVKHWKDEFMKTNQYDNEDEYVEYIRTTTSTQMIAYPGYLAAYLAAMKVMQTRMTPKSISRTMCLLKAEDGPFLYQHLHDWDSLESLLSLCQPNSASMAPIIKFTGQERWYLENEPELRCFLDAAK
jgi:hypothetical protein